MRVCSDIQHHIIYVLYHSARVYGACVFVSVFKKVGVVSVCVH